MTSILVQFQEEGDPQPVVVQAKFTVQVSRALGSWKKHQPSVSVVQPSRTSVGTSEAASPTDPQDLERTLGVPQPHHHHQHHQHQHHQQQQQQGSSMVHHPIPTEHAPAQNEGAFGFGPYQMPQAQAARAY
jgi:hypothetical protein